ncbi:MAG: tetratricopeptide repeat protein [Rhizobiaceae bacterium]|nr:tetratricopeptide repeat protein [Rhizobiaceae bacterium]
MVIATLREGKSVAGEHIRPGDIEDELERILGSSEFRASSRRKEMLRFLVGETLAGRDRMLKGYAIGVSVFGRGPDFDAQADPVVRLEARRLRRDLASYYVAEGRNNPLRISIPKGGYAPEVHRTGADLALRAANPSAEVLSEDPEYHAPELASPSSVVIATTDRLKTVSGLMWTFIAGGVAVALVALLSYVALGDWYRQPAKGPVISQPSVMVLPFDAVGSSQENAFLAVGIADQIVTELSRFSDFRLYLPKVPTGQQVAEDPLETGSRIGATYVVAGRVSSDESGVRIGARLLEVPSGRVLWADEFDRAMAPQKLLTVQGDIADAIATALGQPYGVIKTEMTRQLAAGFSPTMTSYECVLRGYAYRRSFARELHAPVLTCLQYAVKRDPEYADAWAMLGWLYLDAARFDFVPKESRPDTFDKALDAASHAVSLDGKSVLALKALASINHYLGNYEEAERTQRQALALNPNDPDTLAQLGWRMAVRGNFEEGIPYLRRAIERTVNPPGWYFHLIAVDHYLNGRYPEMLAAAKRGIGDGSGVSWSLAAIAYGAMGNAPAAQEALVRMVEIAPALGKDPAEVYRRHGATDDIANALAAGLRNAARVASN